jgi:hypothetical protein
MPDDTLYENWRLQKLGCHTYTLMYLPLLHIKHEIPYLMKLHKVHSRSSWCPKATNPNTLSHVFHLTDARCCLWKHSSLMVIQLMFFINSRMYVLIMWHAVLRIVQGTESTNDTILFIILKVKNPTLSSQLWPMCLCNIFYTRQPIQF